jgi:hypothetical protein
MKTSILPISCCFALTAFSAAGFSHWWSLQQFAGAIHPDAPIAVMTRRPAPATPTAPSSVTPAPSQTPSKMAPAIARNASTEAPSPHPEQKPFFEALIEKMNGLQTQNRDLLDQLAETNRDLMKLEFRVDTYSESFRPLPVTEERPFTSIEDSSGVLPPRAAPMVAPSRR